MASNSQAVPNQAASVRTFVAIDCDAPPPLNALLRELRRLSPSPRMVAGQSLHITLKFLGETQRTAIPVLRAVLDAVAATHSATMARLIGLGAFPNLRRPSVLWAGIEPQEPLHALAEDLHHQCDPLGFQRETRAYQPHLTLARLDHTPDGLDSLFVKYRGEDFGSILIRQLILYQSELKSQGPVYTPLHVSQLKS